MNLFLFPFMYIFYWYEPEHLEQTIGSWQYCRQRAISEVSSYLVLDIGSI